MIVAHSWLNLAGCCARHVTWRDLTVKRAYSNFPRLLTSFFKALFNPVYFNSMDIDIIKSKKSIATSVIYFTKSSIMSLFSYTRSNFTKWIEKTMDWLIYDILLFWISYIVFFAKKEKQVQNPCPLLNSFSTGKSLSEALIFAEHGENMLCT